MQRDTGLEVSLSAPVDMAFLPLATAFVEKAAAGLGMEEPDALSLTLAAEEIFAYLTHVTAADQVVRVTCRGRRHYVEEIFVFPAQGFDMRAFNLTSSVASDEDAARQETGLLIASRMVDRFHFHESEGNLRLTMTKEKTYPHIGDETAPEPVALEDYSVREPESEELKLFIRLVNRHYPGYMFPSAFQYPGKVADMVAEGDYRALVVVDSAGRIGGGAVWTWVSDRLVELMGPYLFNQPDAEKMSEALVDACLGFLGKTTAVGLINRAPTPELPDHYFEHLGKLTLRLPDGETKEISVSYRHLEEDMGTAVWAHPSLEEFLSEQYRRLAFAREIRPAVDEGETVSPFSVLSAQFDRSNGRVMLRPVWWGDDSQETVRRYVETLRGEGIPTILFEMDLGKGWQTRFTPALLDNGFRPRLVLPYGGKADLVVFQHSEESVS